MLLRTIYLAASYTRLHELRECAAQLTAMGFDVTCDWLDEEPAPPGSLLHDDGEHTKLPPLEQQRWAVRDLEQLLAADLVLAFTHDPGVGPVRGGRHVELGAAIAGNLVQGRPGEIWVVGPAENIFCHHPAVRVFGAFAGARRELHQRIIDGAAQLAASAARN